MLVVSICSVQTGIYLMWNCATLLLCCCSVIASYNMHETYAVVAINLHICSVHVMVYCLFYVRNFCNGSTECKPGFADVVFSVEYILVMLPCELEWCRLYYDHQSVSILLLLTFSESNTACGTSVHSDWHQLLAAAAAQYWSKWPCEDLNL